MPTLRRLLQKPGDLNGFWALFADNLANMMIIAAVCTGVFGMPREVVFGRIMPGVAIALIVGLTFYFVQAWRLARREQREDVTALPYGISTPIMFVYLFGVIGPVYWATGDAICAWQVGVAAALLGGVLEALGSIIGPALKRVTPRAGMLGTLAGIALVWIATVPLAEVFEHPLIGLPAVAIIFMGLVAGVRLPGGIPAGLLAIVVGTAIGFAMGESKWTPSGLGWYWPATVLTDIEVGLKYIASHPQVLTIILPIEIYNFIETMNNVESAESAGDRYDVRTSQLMDGVGTMVGALFGNPFPTTVYIGHPAYKRLGAGCGYALYVGLVFLIGNTLGMLVLLHDLIPVAAVAPILVFVGMVICAQAFSATPRRHAMAVAIAMVPHISDIVAKQLSSLSQHIQTLNGSASLSGAVGETLGALSSGNTPQQIAQRLAQDGVHIFGHEALSRGAILTGLIWGAMAALLIDRLFLRAAAFAVAAVLLSLGGFIHAPSLGFHYQSQACWGYVLVALLLAAAHWFAPAGRCSTSRPPSSVLANFDGYGDGSPRVDRFAQQIR